MIEIPHLKSDQLNSVVLGDVCDCTPTDTRHVYKFAVESAPAGSVAKFAGPRLVPDKAGRYVLSVTAGTHVETFRLFVFTRDAYEGLAWPAGTAPGGNAVTRDAHQRSEAQRRGILRAVARHRTIDDLESINSGKWPSSLSLAAYGG